MADIKTGLIAATNVFQNSKMSADIALGVRDASDLAETAAEVAKGASNATQAVDKVTLTGKLGYAGGIGVFAMSAAATADAMIHIAKNPAAFSNYSETLLQGLAGMADGVEDVALFAANNSTKFSTFLTNNPGVAKVIEKIGGPAAIVSGLLNLKQAIPELIDQIKAARKGEGDTKALVSAAMGTLSAGLTTAGGVLMMTGGGVPVGAALVAAGGVLSLAQYAMDNWDSIKAGAKVAKEAVSNGAHNAATTASNLLGGAKKWLFGQ
ncbi:MAG TPA: hypothetical protein DD435_03100 [Cyanobacteria bacterium UBA8530]|nr:hypothetical protein [Cyanobacteria bacterium UBA8530]